ncbi:MAG: glutathione S-transferase C-terminal domain-containing protein, partial [Rhizobiales bacterium]|nr:glutathione S-transferase C-terminal domain-containing protein [Hyphomicrobiales bacterium]
YLDELAGEEKAMIAPFGPERRRALKVCALATGLADKAVSLVYEAVLRKDESKVWVERCKTQIAGVLDALEADRADRPSPWWFGDRIGHADIAVACAYRFTTEAHPGLLGDRHWPRVEALSAECEALSVFAENSQAVSPPKA